MAMAHERLSRLQRHILTWLMAEAQRTRGTMAADHHDLTAEGRRRASQLTGSCD
jgi:hypothetical protein